MPLTTSKSSSTPTARSRAASTCRVPPPTPIPTSPPPSAPRTSRSTRPTTLGPGSTCLAPRPRPTRSCRSSCITMAVVSSFAPRPTRCTTFSAPSWRPRSARRRLPKLPPRSGAPPPRSYDDAVEALRWVSTTEEEWLREGVDFSRCYLMGTSAGGNIAYHVGLRVCAAAADLEPLVIRGLILHHPFFGGSRRTESEVRLFNNQTLPVNVADKMWELSLPAGADRDHEYCNPTGGERSEEWERMKKLGWRVVVVAGSGDPLIDRQRELAAKLEAKGVEVVGLFGGEGDYHGVEIIEPAKAEPLFEKLKSNI
ncbi:hypothetical protein EUGRSUZ_J01052 [Eucalyptus grandis]|uniref:Uncharacterized protein n=2 Tax=Eucalyptus grandis TaxID=71139 RepID=A0ACC3J508_EUCGR|nr:hypothetical protein EUGRSUZ_J01052 [Eucalyptus grandis]